MWDNEPKVPEGTKIPLSILVVHALFSEAYAARMYGDNPGLPPEAVEAYRWAERQFVRIANQQVDERDLIG